MNPSSILITRPDHDPATREGHKWFAKVLEFALEKEEFSVYDLEGSGASEYNFTNFIKQYDPLYITGIGHGNAQEYTGWQNKTLLKVGYNEILCKDRVIYLLSCSTGKQLGQSLINNGALAYLGYKEDFVLFLGKEGEGFGNASNQISFSLITGKNSLEAMEDSIKVWNQNIENADPNTALGRAIIKWSLWDRDALIHLGIPSYITETADPPEEPPEVPPLKPCFLCSFCRKLLKCPI